MNTLFEQGAISIEEMMSSEFTKLESKIQKRNNINLYGGLASAICLSILYIFLLLFLPSVMYNLMPSMGVGGARSLSNYISFFVIIFLLFVVTYTVSKRIPVISPIQVLFYYCYKISTMLEEYLKDEDPSSLIESIKAIKKINEELTKVKVKIKNVPILRHNLDYKEFLKLRSLFRDKVKNRLKSGTEIEDIEILKSAFDMLSQFFYDDEVNSSALSIAIEKLENLEDRPLKIFVLGNIRDLINEGMSSDNVLVRYFTFYIIMVIIMGCVCGIASFFGAPKSILISAIITIPFIVAVGLVTAVGKGK